MILKKKELFLLIFLIFLQSCSGGRIGNFLESSFNDLEKTSKIEDLQNNLLNKNDINLEKENKKFDNKKIKKVEIVLKVLPMQFEFLFSSAIRSLGGVRSTLIKPPQLANNIMQPIIKRKEMLNKRSRRYLMLYFLFLFSFFLKYF